MLRAVVAGAGEWRQRVEIYGNVLGHENVYLLIDSISKRREALSSEVRMTEDAFAVENSIIDTWGTVTENLSIVREALRHGVGVVCHGPFAESMEEARDMLQGAGSRLLVAHEIRYSPKYELVKDQLDTGELGTLTNVRLVWLTSAEPDLGRTWMMKQCFEAADALCWLGGDAKRVMAKGQALKGRSLDNLFGIVRYDNDSIGYVEVGTCYPVGYCFEQMEVVCRRGMLSYDSDTRPLKFSSSKGELTREEVYRWTPLERMLGEYVAFFQEGRPIRVKSEDTLRALELLDALMRSAMVRRVVEL